MEKTCYLPYFPHSGKLLLILKKFLEILSLCLDYFSFSPLHLWSQALTTVSHLCAYMRLMVSPLILTVFLILNSVRYLLVDSRVSSRTAEYRKRSGEEG